MTSIFNMFGRSPLKYLEQHMVIVEQCVMTLGPFMDAVFADDWVKAGEARTEIAQLENQADDIKRDVRLNMPSRLFMPVSRSDVLALVGVQDSVANQAKDISGVVYGRQMVFPDAIKAQYKAFLSRCIDAVRQAEQAINELDELQEAGFSGQEVKVIERMIRELAKIEFETDELQVEIRSQLYQLEKDWPPVDMMFLYKVIEWTGMVADRAQAVGDRLQMLISR